MNIKTCTKCLQPYDEDEAADSEQNKTLDGLRIQDNYFKPRDDKCYDCYEDEYLMAMYDLYGGFLEPVFEVNREPQF